MHKIESLLKDINVIFAAAGDDVKVTTTNVYNDGAPSTTEAYNYHLFFLNLSSGMQDKSWQNAVTKAFSKAGLNIRMTYGMTKA